MSNPRLRTALLLVIGLLFTSLEVAVASEKRIIDVVSVTWSGAQANVTLADVEQAVRSEVGPRWKRYTSFEGSGVDRSLSFELGATLQAPISLTRAMQCEGSQSTSFMGSIRQEAYKRLNIENWSERYLIILAPEAGCIWSGRALIGRISTPGGVMVLHNTASEFVIAHELGHSLGLGHANFLRCDSGKNDGPWGSDCKAVEYGGAIDVMGNVDVDNPLSTYSQWLLGYLEKEQVRQSWLNESIELSATDLAEGTKAIFLRDGKSTYWIEYRRASATSTYKPGLVIYRTDPPPISSVVSPNPEDALSPEYDQDVTADFWMLNWDDYSYARSKASGSMALPEGKTATVYSGNISIRASATSSPNKVLVSINRKTDSTPPPMPELTDSSSWRYPGTSLIKAGYEDGESAIASFEAEIDGKVLPIAGSENTGFAPTYLNPITPAKTVFPRDLPEGNYNISLRAIDVWGNKSPWSKSVRTYIDRGNPIISNDFSISSYSTAQVTVSWSGVKDEGIGLCESVFVNPEGFVLARSIGKDGPNIFLKNKESFKATGQLFDCLGNGMSGEISLSVTQTPVQNSRRTGKWSTLSSGAMRCSGKCSASFSATGKTQVLMGEGSATLLLTGKSVGRIAASSSNQIRLSEVIEVGDRSQVLRISGSNFTLSGIVKIESKLGEFKPLAQVEPAEDESLLEPEQKSLARLGFNSGDFSQEWTVLPMSRGTTLLDPTLDLCGANYSSESGRESRRQISVFKNPSPYIFLSTEVVKYKSIAAADSALTELRKNYATCVQNKGGIENGIFTPYIFKSIPTSDALLVDEKNRVVVRAVIGSGDNARELLAFYQFDGAYFTGFYIVKPNGSLFSDDEVLRWYKVASTLATRLKSK